MKRSNYLLSCFLLLISYNSLGSFFNVENTTLVFLNEYHLHNSDITFQATFNDGYDPKDTFSTDLKMRFAPLGYYFEGQGYPAGEDGDWIYMGEHENQWNRLDTTLSVGFTNNELGATYCSLNTFYRLPKEHTEPKEQLYPDIHSCTITPRQCIHSTSNSAKARFCQPYEDPLIIDLGRDGFKMGQSGIGVYFDYQGTGKQQYTQWVSAGENDAFLAYDKNNDGVINNGRELFAQGDLLGQNRNAGNGFEDLSQYDAITLGGNDDGKITSADDIWSKLSLWLDKNADGHSTSDEMLTLEQFNIQAIDVRYKIKLNKKDKAGNLFPFWSKIKGANKIT